MDEDKEDKRSKRQSNFRKSLARPGNRRSTFRTSKIGDETSSIGMNRRMPSKVYRQPSFWDAQGGGFQPKKRDVKFQQVGLNSAKGKAALQPQWATKMIDAGLDPMMAIKGLTTDEIAAYLDEEGQMYQLTEGEITQLKHLIELQLLLEADPDIGNIEGADEVLNLMARLAGVGGDLTELHPADQAAILSLIQFNNVVPGFGPMFDEDGIESIVEGANNFVQYTDHTGTPVFIRKGSYVKAQVLEKKVEGEIKNFESFQSLCFMALYAIMVIYGILKITVLIIVFLLTGDADGYHEAMLKIETLNKQAINYTVSD